jgi:hypothetical protein
LKKELSRGTLITLVILAIGLVTALALALTDLVRNVLAVPITQTFYFMGLLLKSTPQAVFWGMVLLFLLVVAGKSLQEVRQPETPQFSTLARSSKRVQLSFWASQVNLALRGDQYSYTRLIELLAGLALELDERPGRISTVEIRQLLESGELQLPLEIENYLKARLETGYVPRPSFRKRVAERLAWFWHTISGKNSRPPGASGGRLTQAELEKIIQYLEDRLEV